MAKKLTRREFVRDSVFPQIFTIHYERNRGIGGANPSIGCSLRDRSEHKEVVVEDAEFSRPVQNSFIFSPPTNDRKSNLRIQQQCMCRNLNEPANAIHQADGARINYERPSPKPVVLGAEVKG